MISHCSKKKMKIHRTRNLPPFLSLYSLTPEDVDEWVKLRSLRENKIPPQLAMQWKKQLQDSSFLKDNHSFIVRANNYLIAYAHSHYYHKDNTSSIFQAPYGWYLTGLMIHPDYRRKGIGRYLTSWRIEKIQAISDKVYYFTNIHNVASVKLHEELGFQEKTRDFQIPGVEFSGEGVLFFLGF